jgi:hypothetical protein
MAEESLKAQVVLTVDDSGAVQSVNNLSKAINTAGDASKSWIKQLGELKTQLSQLDPKSAEWANLAIQYKELGGSAKVVSQSYEELRAQSEGAAVSSQSLKSQLRELQAQLANTAPDSKKYRELSQAAGELKDKISDAAQAVGTQAGGAFERVSGSLGLVTSRISSLDFEGAAEGAKLLAKNITDIKPGDITNGIKGIGNALGSVGKALLTNPIFLIGAAIAAAIVYADQLLPLVDGVSDAESERLKLQEQSASVSKEALDSVSAQENILKLQGKTEKEILDIKIKKADQALIDQKAVIETLELQRIQQIEAAERNRDILKGLLNFISLPLTALLAGVDLLTAGLNKAGLITDETFSKVGNLRDKFTTSIAELVFDPKEVASKGDETIKAARKTYENLENQQAGFQLSVQNLGKSAAAETNKKNEQQLKSEQDLQAELNKTREESFQASLTAEEKELRQTALKYKELEEKAGTNAALLKQIKEQELIDLQAITDRYFAEELAKQAEQEAKRLEAERAAAAKANEQRIITEDNYFKLSRDLDNKNTAAREGDRAAKKEKEIEDLVAEYDEKFALASGNAELEKRLQDQQKRDLARIDRQYKDEQKAADDKSNADRIDAFMKTSTMITQSAQDGLNTLISLNEAFSGKSERSQKKSFQRNKALQIGLASVQTYQSATAAYASQVIPGDPSSVVRGTIAAAAAIAAGLANIAKIKATTYEAPAPSGGNNSTNSGGDLASTGVASSGVPEFNPLANLGLQNQPAQTIPAYVLAGDVANAMEAREKVTDLSRL